VIAAATWVDGLDANLLGGDAGEPLPSVSRRAAAAAHGAAISTTEAEREGEWSDSMMIEIIRPLDEDSLADVTALEYLRDQELLPFKGGVLQLLGTSIGGSTSSHR
jgi:hypothetical protein